MVQGESKRAGLPRTVWAASAGWSLADSTRGTRALAHPGSMGMGRAAAEPVREGARVCAEKDSWDRANSDLWVKLDPWLRRCFSCDGLWQCEQNICSTFAQPSAVPRVWVRVLQAATKSHEVSSAKESHFQEVKGPHLVERIQTRIVSGPHSRLSPGHMDTSD